MSVTGLLRNSRVLRFSIMALPLWHSPVLARNVEEQSQAVIEGSESDEILVVAERRSERLQDIPIAITTFTGEMLNRAGIDSTLALSTVTPGLNITAATGSAAPFLRGVGNNNVGPSAESSVATYVDGVYYASVSSTVFKLTGVKQIDVLKGPQGTLFGRNATGGVIQITTKDPSPSTQGNLSFSYGNYNTVEVKGYLTGSLAQDLSANIILGYENQGDGYGTNLATGNDTNKSKSFSVRSKLLWKPGADTAVTLAADYDYFRTSQGIAWRPPYGSTPALDTAFTGRVQDISLSVDPYAEGRQGGVSLRVEQDLGFAQLLSISAIRREEQFVLTDQDFTAVPFFTAAPLKKTDQYSQELQLLGPSSNRIQWVAGLYGLRLESAYDPATLKGPAIAPLSELKFYNAQQSWSGAIFGQITVQDILPRTDFTAGARYTVDQAEILIQPTGIAGGAEIPLPGTSDKTTWRSPTWRLSLDHKFSPDLNGYISYNRGFKSGTYNLLIIPASAVRPEKLDALEVGVKVAVLDRRLRINTAVFFYKFSDMQVPRYQVGGPILTNAGKSRIYGLDMDVSFEPTPALSFRAGLSLLDAKYDEFEEAVLSISAPRGGNTITLVSAARNQIQLTPDATFNAMATYRFGGNLEGLEANATYYYNDGWFGDPDNRLRQDSFSQINAQLSYAISDEKYRIVLFGRNLTNKVFAQYISGTSGFSDVYAASSPRTFGVRLETRF